MRQQYAKRRVKRLNNKAAQEQAAAQKSMMTRAMKRIGLDFELDATPAAQLRALEAYVDELRDLKDDLRSKYGDIPEFNRASAWLGYELDRALQQITKLSIEAVKNV